MSGHSKWSTIKHQKATADQKRGKVFSKVAKLITVAVKEGGAADPAVNARLRLAIEQAKAVNMPKENIKRAIEKGLGKGGGGAALERVSYEGFGPEKVALVIECITDNKNRTGAEIKSFLERQGGGLGTPGSARYLFEKKGLILIQKNDESEKQILRLIDLGVDDVVEEENFIEVYTRADQLGEIKEKIKKTGFVIKEASLSLKPTTLIPLEKKEKKEKVIAFLAEIESHDDVQKVYCNADFISSSP